MLHPFMYYFHPCLLAKSPIAKQNLSHRANVICDGSPSRMRMVRRISFGITTRPRSSILLTIPVAFISSNLSCCCFFMAETCSRRSFSIRQLVMLEKLRSGNCGEARWVRSVIRLSLRGPSAGAHSVQEGKTVLLLGPPHDTGKAAAAFRSCPRKVPEGLAAEPVPCPARLPHDLSLPSLIPPGA